MVENKKSKTQSYCEKKTEEFLRDCQNLTPFPISVLRVIAAEDLPPYVLAWHKNDPRVRDLVRRARARLAKLERSS